MFIFIRKHRVQIELAQSCGGMSLQALKPAAGANRFAQPLGKLLLGCSGILIALTCHGCSGTDRDARDSAEPGETVFTIEGKAIPLKDGAFTGEDGTLSLLESRRGDLDNDGHDDLAAVLVLDSTGSGVFYYLNVLLNAGEQAAHSTREEFIGDRIKFDYMDIYGPGSVSRLTGVPIHPDDHGQLVVGYYVHGPGQAYSEDPGLYVTRHWKIDNSRLVPLEDY
jgi:hypothetical protein